MSNQLNQSKTGLNLNKILEKNKIRKEEKQMKNLFL